MVVRAPEVVDMGAGILFHRHRGDILLGKGLVVGSWAEVRNGNFFGGEGAGDKCPPFGLGLIHHTWSQRSTTCGKTQAITANIHRSRSFASTDTSPQLH